METTGGAAATDFFLDAVVALDFAAAGGVFDLGLIGTVSDFTTAQEGGFFLTVRRAAAKASDAKQ